MPEMMNVYGTNTIAGTVIIIGFALGVQSVTSAKALHLDDNHKVRRALGCFFPSILIACRIGA